MYTWQETQKQKCMHMNNLDHSFCSYFEYEPQNIVEVCKAKISKTRTREAKNTHMNTLRIKTKTTKYITNKRT